MYKKFKNKFKIEELTILNFDNWVVSVRPKQPTIGSLVISLKRKCEFFKDLKPEESKELACVFNEVESLLKKAFSYDKINYLALMMVDEHVHYHVIPRYENSIEFNNIKYEDSAWPGPTNLEMVIKEPEIELQVLEFLKKEQQTKKVIGYTTGVFDLFHIGHLNILKQAKENCDYLIVGVTTDELVSYKNTKSVIPFEERKKIVEGIKYVDKVVPQTNMNKMKAWEELHFNRMFVGSDWQGTEKWNKFEEEFAKIGVDIHYFPYTKGTSSTKLKKVLEQLLDK